MTLDDEVADVFGPDGALSRADPLFRPRAGQTEMAIAVAQTIAHGGALVVEAGTGVGKTFAYLVPALLSGEKVLLSTATKTLQDQLFARDLPRLVQALNLPVRTALLKGRSSYLCAHRLEGARQQVVPGGADLRHTLSRIEIWAQGTRTGDLAELVGLDDRSPAIPLVTSTRENCLGSGCAHFRACHVNAARREALAADVVVVNHHLFFADVAVRESGVGELLPTTRVVVFDEAHQINETGVQFLGVRVSTGQLLDLAHDVLAAGLRLARGLVDWPLAAASLGDAARELRLVAGSGVDGSLGRRMRWGGPAPDGLNADAWGQAMGDVLTACEALASGLDMVSEIAPEFVRLHERTRQLAATVRRFQLACPVDAVRWADAGTQVRLIESPLDIAESMQSRLLRTSVGAAGKNDADGSDNEEVASPSAVDPDEGDGARQRAWIFTSATLGDDRDLKWFTDPCGLTGVARTLRVESPFDYPDQAAIYVPRELPSPSDPDHSAQLARLVGNAAVRLGGRTMVLTTTLRAMRAIGRVLQARFGDGSEIEILVQGEGPKRLLMERFREGAGGGRRGCILVASASFWEGIDVPGDALQLLVVDKLPFPPPDDPLGEARSHRIEEQGRSAFRDYALPEAAVALKQGAGRLIRRETDRGILVVGDTRLRTMGYGRRLLAALPPMKRLESEAEFDQALERLVEITTPSTTGLYWP